MLRCESIGRRWIALDITLHKYDSKGDHAWILTALNHIWFYGEARDLIMFCVTREWIMIMTRDEVCYTNPSIN